MLLGRTAPVPIRTGFGEVRKVGQIFISNQIMVPASGETFRGPGLALLVLLQ